jgi:dihydroneopterin aldolase
MEHIIRLKKISFYAYHGVFRQEQNVGGKFEADIDIYTDFSVAAEKDSLQHTIDYEKVYNTVLELSGQKRYHLIESLAVKVVDTLFERFSNIQKIAFRVRKNNPPIGGILDFVEVEIIKARSEIEGN